MCQHYQFNGNCCWSHLSATFSSSILCDVFNMHMDINFQWHSNCQWLTSLGDPTLVAAQSRSHVSSQQQPAHTTHWSVFGMPLPTCKNEEKRFEPFLRTFFFFLRSHQRSGYSTNFRVCSAPLLSQAELMTLISTAGGSSMRQVFIYMRKLSCAKRFFLAQNRRLPVKSIQQWQAAFRDALY